MASRYDQVVRNGGEGRQRYQTVSSRERERFVSQKQELRTFGRERQRRELSSARTNDARNDDRGANRLQVGRSPMGGRTSGGAMKDVGTPPRLTDRKPSKGVASNPIPDSRKVVGSKPQIGSSKGDNKSGSKEPTAPGGRSTAEVMRNASQETRTQPGQRRASSPASNNNAVASAKARDSDKSKGQPDLASKRQSASLPNGLSKATSNSRQADNRSQFNGKTQSKSQTSTQSRGAVQATERQASPSTQGKVAPQSQRKTAPAVQQSAYSKPQSKAIPTLPRKTYSAPEPKVAPAPQRKTYSAPQRSVAPAPQRKTVREVILAFAKATSV